MRIDVDVREAVSLSKLQKSVRLKLASLVDNPEDFVPTRDVPSAGALRPETWGDVKRGLERKPRLVLTREEMVSWLKLAKSLRTKVSAAVSNPQDLIVPDGRVLRAAGKTLALIVPGRNPRKVTPEEAAEFVGVSVDDLEEALKGKGYVKRAGSATFHEVWVPGSANTAGRRLTVVVKRLDLVKTDAKLGGVK